MKKQQGYFFILVLVALYVISGCTPSEEHSFDNPAISEAFEPTLEPASSAAEIPESHRDPVENTLEEDIDDGGILTSERDAAFEKAMESVEEGTYVVYSSLADTEHVELLHEWVACFEAGEASQPLYLLHNGFGWGNSLALLEYEGGSHYTATNCLSGETVESAVVIKRAIDYLFCTDLPPEEHIFGVLSYIQISHTPLVAEPMEYDLESTPSLGSITVEEACELAILHGIYSLLDSCYANEYWVSNNGSLYASMGEDPVEGSIIATITDAVELMGMPCYRITVEWEMVNGSPAMNTLAVSADGRRIYGDGKMLSGGYSLNTDYDQQYIVAAY